MLTLGIIIGNRGFFPAHLCQAGRQAILKALEAEGIRAISLPEDASKYGAVESLADAHKCADLCMTVLQLLASKCGGVPLLIWVMVLAFLAIILLVRVILRGRRILIVVTVKKGLKIFFESVDGSNVARKTKIRPR